MPAINDVNASNNGSKNPSVGSASETSSSSSSSLPSLWRTWIGLPSAGEGDGSRRTRHRAEIFLSRIFVDTVMAHGRDIIDRKRDRRRLERAMPLGPSGGGAAERRIVEDLTDEELAVFDRFSYYGWTQGTAAGLATFGILFGGLRWAASRRGCGGLGWKAPHAVVPSHSRPSYQQLDGTVTRSRRSSSKCTLSVPQAPSSRNARSHSLLGVADDAMAQLQFICVGALSLVVGNLVAQSFADQVMFFRRLESVPLMPGRSVLCHRVCPDLIRQHQDLLSHNSWDHLLDRRESVPGAPTGAEPTATSAPETTSSSSSFRTRHIPDYSPEDLMRDPETQELESIVRLIRNCEARMAYETELRGWSRSAGDEVGTVADTDPIVTIPPPGVPAFGIAVSDHGGEGTECPPRFMTP